MTTVGIDTHTTGRDRNMSIRGQGVYVAVIEHCGEWEVSAHETVEGAVGFIYDWALNHWVVRIELNGVEMPNDREDVIEAYFGAVDESMFIYPTNVEA